MARLCRARVAGQMRPKSIGRETIDQEERTDFPPHPAGRIVPAPSTQAHLRLMVFGRISPATRAGITVTPGTVKLCESPGTVPPVAGFTIMKLVDRKI